MALLQQVSGFSIKINGIQRYVNKLKKDTQTQVEYPFFLISKLTLIPNQIGQDSSLYATFLQNQQSI